ncbi:MAG: hypothetical protein ACRDV9_04080 [Acidimicrobiia bacterium]
MGQHQTDESPEGQMVGHLRRLRKGAHQREAATYQAHNPLKISATTPALRMSPPSIRMDLNPRMIPEPWAGATTASGP